MKNRFGVDCFEGKYLDDALSLVKANNEKRYCPLLCRKVARATFACYLLLTCLIHISNFILHQTQYQKSDWLRAFNQLSIACELDMINAISAADIAFIMSSSMSAWLLSPLECSQKQNG